MARRAHGRHERHGPRADQARPSGLRQRDRPPRSGAGDHEALRADRASDHESRAIGEHDGQRSDGIRALRPGEARGWRADPRSGVPDGGLLHAPQPRGGRAGSGDARPAQGAVRRRGRRAAGAGGPAGARHRHHRSGHLAEGLMAEQDETPRRDARERPPDPAGTRPRHDPEALLPDTPEPLLPDPDVVDAEVVEEPGDGGDLLPERVRPAGSPAVAAATTEYAPRFHFMMGALVAVAIAAVVGVALAIVQPGGSGG